MNDKHHDHDVPPPHPQWAEIVDQINRCDELIDTVRCLAGLAELIDDGGPRYFKHALCLLFLIEERTEQLDVALSRLATMLRSQTEPAEEGDR